MNLLEAVTILRDPKQKGQEEAGQVLWDFCSLRARKYYYQKREDIAADACHKIIEIARKGHFEDYAESSVERYISTVVHNRERDLRREEKRAKTAGLMEGHPDAGENDAREADLADQPEVVLSRAELVRTVEAFVQKVHEARPETYRSQFEDSVDLSRDYYFRECSMEEVLARHFQVTATTPKAEVVRLRDRVSKKMQRFREALVSQIDEATRTKLIDPDTAKAYEF
ncbi:MAG: hypothetical protein E4G90_05440 [Gemmatimonadales bacterium]|nr:MAG: hypothetical protein E4G90_05440 [Gemmatimonadales bacterium]